MTLTQKQEEFLATLTKMVDELETASGNRPIAIDVSFDGMDPSHCYAWNGERFRLVKRS